MPCTENGGVGAFQLITHSFQRTYIDVTSSETFK